MKKIFLFLFIALNSFLSVNAGCGGFYVGSYKTMPINQGDSTMLKLSPTALSCPYTSNFHWFRNDTLISGATNQFYIAKIAGRYKVRFLVGSSFWDSTFINVKVKSTDSINKATNPLSLDKADKKSIFITAYPNPNNGFFTLKIENIEKAQALIYGLMGELISNQSFQSTSTLNIDISDRPKGIYFVKTICPDGQEIVKKIVYD